ncbi:OmpA family protein [Imperialibacter roseus]|uniref:OmpA family protein n=1 Tax=Imperialibacter roseus TaxID=1324217 RepID=A0ABZ0II90_9BACT|nr:OmpA family protein [Imperialibacter roseus]WOK04759.1 OmpA family protein [Imperialibacter roseus]
MKNSTYLRITSLALLAVGVLLPYAGSSQGKHSTYVRAEDSFYDEELETAFLLFNEYLTGSPDDRKAQYYAEICSLLTYYPAKPLDKFLQFEATLGTSDKFFYYWAGRIYAARYDYGAAIEAWQKFLDLKAYKSKVITDETKAFIEDAIVKKSFIEHPSTYSVHHLPAPINTLNSEENPILFDNESKLMLASIGNDESVRRRKQRSTIYFFERQGKNKWSAPVSYPAFKEMKGNIVNLQLFDNETKLLLYYEDKKGDLYQSEKVNGVWQKPKPLEQIDRSGMQVSGFFTSNGEVLVYTAESKKPDKDIDLYMVTRQGEGQWSAPTELQELNSPFDEDSPYITPDGSTIYFSSRGHSSIGGFDIFKSARNPTTGKWGTPENLGYPINTPGDEIFFKFNKDGKTGFFSSDRAGTVGFLDAYLFVEEIKIPMKGRVIASSTKQPLAGVLVKVTPDNQYLNTLSAESNQDGEFEVLLTSGFDQTFDLTYMGLHAKTESISVDQTSPTNILNKVFEIDLTETILAQQTHQQGVQQGKSAVPTKTTTKVASASTETTAPISEYTELGDLGKKFSKGNKAILSNIYFEPGSDYISSAYTPELFALFKVMSENPELRIEIGGHTDALEEKTSTQNLSKLRARAVGSYLMQRRISENRIKEVGYGATQPLASNDNEKEGRELNRRIEVLVIE